MTDSDLPRGTYPRPCRPLAAPLTCPPAAGTQVAGVLTGLTLGDQVGVALRDHRARLGLSQRAYAAMRGWRRSALARLEGNADGCRLRDVVDALQGTGFDLALVRLPQSPRTPVAMETLEEALRDGQDLAATESGPGDERDVTPEIIDPTGWPVVELVARARGVGRRLPDDNGDTGGDRPRLRLIQGGQQGELRTRVAG